MTITNELIAQHGLTLDEYQRIVEDFEDSLDQALQMMADYAATGLPPAYLPTPPEDPA